MYRMLAATSNGVSGCSSYLGSLRSILLLLASLTPQVVGAATVVYNPVSAQTVQWEWSTGTWNRSVKEGLFVQGARETTVAEAFFDLPRFDWAEIDYFIFQITIPAVYSDRPIAWTKIYAAPGDAIVYPLQELPGRSLLYSFDSRTTTMTVMNFDITAALRNSDLLGASGGQYRFDFITDVIPLGSRIPLNAVALIVNTVPEPSSALLAVAGLGLLALGRGRRS
jgi:hypothetical protein